MHPRFCSQLSVKYVVGRSPAEESGFFSQGDILTSVDGQVPHFHIHIPYPHPTHLNKPPQNTLNHYHK
jgi:hypothetical protein